MPTILHLDMNSYFATVEQQSNPFLRGKPICVGGKGPGERTVCCAASIEAKKFGVKSGTSTWEARKLCPNIIVVEADYNKYQYISQKVFAILESYTPLVEVFSIDEAFADITYAVIQKGFIDAVPISMEIKARIQDEIGDYLKCSIGIAPNKLLAKLASDMVKPDGLTIIKNDDIDAIRRKTSIEDLCGVGFRLKERLNNIGITTMFELGEFPAKSLIKLFGPHLGNLLHNMGKGIDNSPVSPYYEMPEEKSFGHSYTLPQDITDIDSAKRVLLKLSEKVGRRMRKADFMGRTVHLYLRYFDRSDYGQRVTLSRYINDGYDIYKVACGLLERCGDRSANNNVILNSSEESLNSFETDSSRQARTIYSSSERQRVEKFYKPIRLVGVSVTNILHSHQISLPILPEDTKEEQVKNTLDTINDKFGEFTVFRGALVEIKDRIENIPDGRNKRMPLDNLRLEF